MTSNFTNVAVATGLSPKGTKVTATDNAHVGVKVEDDLHEPGEVHRLEASSHRARGRPDRRPGPCVLRRRYPGLTVPERRGRAAVDSTQGLRWRRALRVAAVLLAVAAALAAAAGIHAAGPASSHRDARQLQRPPARPRRPVTTTTAAAPTSRLTDAQATKIFLAYPKVASWLHRYPSGVTTTATLTAGVWQVNVFYGPAGEIATRQGERRDRAGDRGVHRPAGRLGDGARRQRVRRQEDQRVADLADLLRRLPARARRLAPAVLAQNRRPAGAPLVLAVALVLQPRPDLRGDLARVPRLRLADRALPLDRAPRPRLSRLRRVADLGARGGHALPRRLPDRPEHQPLERHRRRALRSDRRRPDRALPESVRQLPRRGRQAQLRPGGRVGRGPRPHPDERPLRGGRPAGRHVWPGGLPRLPAGLHLPRLERPLGLVADGSLHHDSVGPAGDHRAVVRRGAVRRPATRRRVLVRLGGVAVHAVLVELQHERPDRAGAAHLGLLLPHVAGQTRAVRGASPRGRSSRRSSWFRCGPPTRTRARGGRDRASSGASSAAPPCRS